MPKANQLTKRQIEELRSEIAVGSKQADCGSFVDGKAAFDEIRCEAFGVSKLAPQVSE